MSANKKATLEERLRHHQRELDFLELKFQRLPKYIAAAKAFHAAIVKVERRGRGDRSKTHALVQVEEIAIDLVNRRKQDHRRDGLPGEDAQIKAEEEIAPAFGIKPSVLHEWVRGASRRLRMRKAKNGGRSFVP